MFLKKKKFCNKHHRVRKNKYFFPMTSLVTSLMTSDIENYSFLIFFFSKKSWFFLFFKKKFFFCNKHHRVRKKIYFFPMTSLVTSLMTSDIENYSFLVPGWKPKGSIKSPLSVRPSVRSYVPVDLGNRTYDFPDFFHEVGDKYG